MRLFGSALLLALAATACGAKEPPPVAPAPTATASSTADDANRPSTKDECESLAQSLLANCEKRGNTHSMQIDRWCSDLAHQIADDTWVEKQCVPRIRYIDAVCFQSATNVTSAMDCERSVSP